MPTTIDTTPTSVDRPEWLEHSQWPWPVQRIGDIAYTDTGTGPPLLFVHVGMWSFIWRDLVQLLNKDFRCIVIDPPGSGFSDRTGDVTIAAAADAVTTIVESLDLAELTLVFHDLGGTAALDAAADWPERVRAVAAVNTFGWRPAGAAFRGMLAVMGSRTMQAIDALTGWLPRMTSTRFGVGRHLAAKDRRAFRRGMRGSRRASFHRYMRSVRRHDYQRVDQALRQLADRPLLTVFGEKNDPLGFQPQWAERFAHVEQLEILGGNHFPMCDDPEAVASGIRRLVARV